MAVEQVTNTQLRLILETGYDEEKDQPIYTRKAYNNINLQASAEALLEVAQGIASLQTFPLSTVERANVSEIY